MKEKLIKDKELLLKDLSARLIYGVAISQGPYDENPIRLNSISITSIGTFFNGYFTEGIHFTSNGEGDIWPKPCLRPMSSMTEEEKIEYRNLHHTEKWKHVNNVLEFDVVYSRDIPLYIDWLNAHHFDYRGLIEKGLALEAPKGMYKL